MVLTRIAGVGPAATAFRKLVFSSEGFHFRSECISAVFPALLSQFIRRGASPSTCVLLTGAESKSGRICRGIKSDPVPSARDN